MHGEGRRGDGATGRGHGKMQEGSTQESTPSPHGAEPTFATGMEAAPEAAARREPLRMYLPLRRCAVMPQARTRSSSCAGG